MKIEYSVTVQRPIEEVFAYVCNVENWPRWISGTSEAKQTSPGPIQVGTTFTQLSNFLGRRFEINATVTEYEPNRRFAIANDGKPIPFGNQINFEAVDESTRITDILSSSEDVSGLFKLAAPVMESVLRKQFEKDREHLKEQWKRSLKHGSDQITRRHVR